MFRDQCRQESDAHDHGTHLEGLRLPARPGEKRESRSVGMAISRRDILKSLWMAALGGSVLRVIPLEAAEYAHRIVKAEKAAAETHAYSPKFFSARAYKTLQNLCNAIIPPDDDAKGAVEAGAPEFIDLLTSENKDYQLALGGGLMWLDNTCIG